MDVRNEQVCDAVAALQSFGGGPLLVEALSMQARLESEPISKDPAERQQHLSNALETLAVAEAAAIECSTVARPANLRADLRCVSGGCVGTHTHVHTHIVARSAAAGACVCIFAMRPD
jgi:hypothetical protein